MQYTEKELSTLIANVEKEFTAHLAKAEESFLAKSEDAAAPLVKAEEAAPAPEKKDEKAEEKPEHKEEPKKDDAKEAAPAQEREEPKDDAKAAPPESKEHAPAKEGADNQEGHDYDEQDMEHMHKMYSSMSRGELKAHHDSVKRALDSHGAAEQAGEQPMAKSEDVKSVEVKPEVVVAASNETELLKSELEAEKAKASTLQKNLDAVSAFLTKLVEKKGAPAAKAITSYDTIAKSEGGQEEKTLTKAEIDSVLMKKSQDPKLEKSDREAINAYYLSNAGINTISHLLK